MPSDAVKDALHLHRALWELGQVSAFEILSDGVVETPEGVISELWVARVAELLDRLVYVALWERALLSARSTTRSEALSSEISDPL